jgi:two-component system chemotaxis sensor kinase CheA
MARFCKHLRAMAKAISKEDIADDAAREKAARCAKEAGDLVEGIILEDVKDKNAAWNKVNELVTALQQVISRQSAGPDPAPASSGAPQASSAATVEPAAPANPAAQSAGFQLPVGVDETIFQAFIEQEQSVMPELEALILALEKSRDQETLAALRRMIHTLKGESGMVGVVGIEKLCHKVEDYIDRHKDKVPIDRLIEAKDWIEQAIAMLAAGEMPGMPDDLIRRFADEPSKGSPEPKPRPAPAPAKPPSPAPAVPAPGKAAAGAPEQPQPTASHPKTVLPPEVVISDPDMARDFVTEAHEHFESADENLMTLESDPGNTEAVGAVFRAFHTIKGVSGFLGLTTVQSLAHVAETLLDEVRKGKRRFAGRVSDVTFASVDMLKNLVADVKASLASGLPVSTRTELAGVIDSVQRVLDGVEPVATAAPGEDPPEPAEEPETSAASADAQTSGALVIAQPIKVSAEKVDLLLDTIGEMVIAQSIVANDKDLKRLQSPRLEKNLALLGKITRMLQDLGMGMRMVPIEATFRKMARLVRDLSKKSGKPVEFEMLGKETELDRGMVDKLSDPLVHMIRNSMDHGLEDTPADRVKAGKPREGKITLNAFHKGGSIHIEITDDGRGLNRDKILAKGIERGVIQSAAGMSDSDIFALIFEAGFSTADKVTEISGRGVGMDVVRRNVASLRGNVLIRSEKGKGSTFTIVLPLTMAIIDGMLAKVGDETYIIPTLSIMESLRPTEDMLSTVLGQGEIIRFRGSHIPLFRLHRLFGSKGAIERPTDGIVMIVEESGRQTGLLVDALLGQQQTVIKTLGEAVGRIPCVAGASIMADGKPGLILDIGGLLKLASEQGGRTLRRGGTDEQAK